MTLDIYVHLRTHVHFFFSISFMFTILIIDVRGVSCGLQHNPRRTTTIAASAGIRNKCYYYDGYRHYNAFF
jgi:hypothetical protein